MKAEWLLEQSADEAWAGFVRSVPMEDRKFLTRMNQALGLFANAKRLPYPLHHAEMYQAMGSADFPLLTSAVLERRLAAEFRERPNTVERKFARVPRMNFNNNQVVTFDGLDYMLEIVGPGGEYTNATFDESETYYKLKKWGRKAPLAWEMLKNDDLGAFNRIPGKMAKGARMTRDKYLTEVFWTANGAKSTVVTSGIGAQDSVSNLPLDAANLATAIQAMGSYKREGGPVLARPAILEVGPALEFKAKELTKPENLQAIVTGLQSTSAKSTERVSTYNYILEYGLDVQVNPWFPFVMTTGTYAQTAWALYCSPDDIPAGELGVLMGEEEPQVFVKAGNQQRVGGGMDGSNLSFETDSVEFKVRDVFEAVQSYKHGCWHSNGQ
jgi:hypothetical protein